ncbi:MAG TPA: hypothetical protein VKR58_10445 [Aquella sp.]|nr:hypothetical protein [Aquella sp.]
MLKKISVLVYGVMIAAGLVSTSFAETCPDGDKIYNAYENLKNKSKSQAEFEKSNPDGFTMGATEVEWVYDENHGKYEEKDFEFKEVRIEDWSEENAQSEAICAYGKFNVSFKGIYKGKNPDNWWQVGERTNWHACGRSRSECEFEKK